MTTLREGYNPEYSYLASILTGRPNRVTVEVEDTIDAAFWGDLLRSIKPEKDFHFKTYHTVVTPEGERNITGKSRIMKMCSQFTAYHIGCIDADNDWILSQTSPYGDTILNNQFLLHTYAYSIENMLCDPCTFTSLCEDVAGKESDTSFVEYCRSLSEIIYPLLVWSLYLINKGHNDFTPTQWQKLFMADMEESEGSICEVERRVAERVSELEEKYKAEIDQKKSFQQYLSEQKGLTVTTAYWHVYGHALFNFIHRCMLKPEVYQLQKDRIAEIKVQSPALEVGTKIRQYISSTKDIVKALSHNYRYKDYNLYYRRISADVERVW